MNKSIKAILLSLTLGLGLSSVNAENLFGKEINISSRTQTDLTQTRPSNLPEIYASLQRLSAEAVTCEKIDRLSAILSEVNGKTIEGAQTPNAVKAIAAIKAAANEYINKKIEAINTPKTSDAAASKKADVKPSFFDRIKGFFKKHTPSLKTTAIATSTTAATGIATAVAVPASRHFLANAFSKMGHGITSATSYVVTKSSPYASKAAQGTVTAGRYLMDKVSPLAHRSMSLVAAHPVIASSIVATPVVAAITYKLVKFIKAKKAAAKK